ncbi:MAG TPA: acyl-CoA synthetase [Acidimicrobiales bacterium]|nr:acyl-CoA synthetase [Acidimicrobiales bacterium]
MTSWTFADVWEAIAAAQPDRPAHIQGERVVTWRQFDARADALAAHLVAAGLGHQAKVAAYLYNGPEYLETYVACFKAGLAPLNVNYRYGPDEVTYLLDNADAEAVVFHSSLSGIVEQIRPRLPGVKRWYVVSDGGPEPDWAVPYEPVATRKVGRAKAPWGRSGDDLLLLYTGGTTGMPKGVMWRQDDLFNVLGAGGNITAGQPPAADLDDLAGRITQPGMRMLPACPLMHGTGQFSALIAMGLGGSVVTLNNRSLDPEVIWSTVEELKVNSVVIVGDAFARPLLAALDANPGRWDLSSLLLMSSSGVMWSQEVKEGLLKHHPGMVLFDSFGSSEAVGMGASTSTAGAPAATASFQLGPRVKVFTDDGRPVEPGSDEAGFVAIGGFLPVGYYKDPEKTARTFRTIDGVRYSVPGDYATVNADGTLHLLGRGSVCINTGGEKVFPEEVEEVLKLHPTVRDAACVGLPDERFGEVICALVEPIEGSQVDDAALIEHVRGALARYKAPRRVVALPSLGRSPSGKLDYAALKSLAMERASSQP